MSYSDLTTTERCYWNVYTRLRQLSDWQGFTDGQESIRAASRAWLESQRKEIWRAAESKPGGWEEQNRRARYEQLKEDSLNAGEPQNLCQLPTGGGTPTEKAKISEREMWWNQSSVDDDTKTWRSSNAGWLTERRKQLYSLCQDNPDVANRDNRYSALCVATKTGKAYDAWAKVRDPVTGATKPPPPKPPPTPTPASSRELVVINARKYLGVSEHPSGSNRGSPQPSGWQKRVYGGDGVPWCACFVTAMAWDVGVKGGSSAGVAVIVSMARRGQGMFRGYTTNPANVSRGDFAIVSCESCHIGLVVDNADACHLIEGNTSPGSEGSQFNGGCVAEKRRPRGNIVGWALVDYP